MLVSRVMESGWQFWIDRGGTFTDIVARRPDGTLTAHKLLSEDPARYDDAALAGVRDILGVSRDASIPTERISAVKIGTTVATNALLERKGEPTALFITRGFGDALRIAYQNRPRIFDRRIRLPEAVYGAVYEVDERMGARGEVLLPLDEGRARLALARARGEGYGAIAIVLMHAYRYPDHERRLAALAREAGFTQVSASHAVSPLMKLVARGDTTVVDAYLSPILRRYVEKAGAALAGTRLFFMQSNGGLTAAHLFHGKNSVLSGPAGGVVGAVRTAAAAGNDRIIGFDMGGTSTDVSHYAGELEREFDTKAAGVRIRAPMLAIHTIAAGGGSILHFDGARQQVGPDSAGAYPGPACYGRGGPLAVTDCNVLLGKIQPAFFPRVFGASGKEALDAAVTRRLFDALAGEIASATGVARTAEQVAEGYLQIAVANMANAIKKISVARGHDVTAYTLVAFGGAAGQHACLVADALAIPRIFIHANAGVLSAYGIGLADIAALRERAIEARLDPALLPRLECAYAEMAVEARAEVLAQGVELHRIAERRRAHLRYEGTDTALSVDFGTAEAMARAFESAYRARYSFLMPARVLIVEAVALEVLGADEPPAASGIVAPREGPPAPAKHAQMYSGGRWHDAPIYRYEGLRPGDVLPEPAIITEANATTIVEPGWQAEVHAPDHLILVRREPRASARAAAGAAPRPDPVLLEIFNNHFMAVAEQMGVTLANTAHSVNMKERLDFSCALFDGAGALIANAPHMPVHLGSMGESVATVIRDNAARMRPGDVYMLNDPYRGGTHLPDITLIAPVFDAAGASVRFYVGARGHHADVGGITPGSMPPFSRRLEEEGVLISNFHLLAGGRFREAEARALFEQARYPARNVEQNLADLRAMVAATQKGARELDRMAAHFGADTVRAYMQHVQQNAAESVRRAIDVLKDGEFAYEMDDGSVIRVAIRIDRKTRSAVIDFSGTAAQTDSNFNAPSAVTIAAVLYVFRTLVDADIPLNAGCLEPLRIIIPAGSLLNPRYPAAVVAGNVETSQCITDALYGALGVMAASQGTMNNFTFGNERYQYYETIAGGSGAGEGFDGTACVQTHMTNSRLTDPEVLEWRFPVLLESFSIRRGSGGAGQWRGGDGAVRRMRFLEPMTAAILSGHRRVPPFGACGGAAGATGRNRIERADGTVEDVGACAEVQMNAGDVFVIETPGGGGFGVGEGQANS